MPKKTLAELTKQSVISTEKPKFKPTPYMIVFLQTAVQYMPETVKETAELCGIDRTLWYDWIKKDGFMDWYLENYTKARRGIIPTLDSIGMKYAKKGSYPHWKDMNRKAGEDLSSPLVDVTTNIAVPILNGLSRTPQTYTELADSNQGTEDLLPEVESIDVETLIDGIPDTTEPKRFRPSNISSFKKTRLSF